MAARLGNVLYWIGCILAALFLLTWFAMPLTAYLNGRDDWMQAFLFGAFYVAPMIAICYGIGRACRYVLAGS